MTHNDKINEWLDYNLGQMVQGASNTSSGHINDILESILDSRVFLKTSLGLLECADISKLDHDKRLLLLVYLQPIDLDTFDQIKTLSDIDNRIGNTPPEFIITSDCQELLKNRIAINDLPQNFHAYSYSYFDSDENVFEPMIIIYKENIKEQILKDILSNDTARITNGLLSLFMNNIDKDLAIQYAKWAMNSDILDIKKIGIIGMGHIARIYGLNAINCFDNEINMIEQTKNAELIGILEDAKDDFSIFIK